MKGIEILKGDWGYIRNYIPRDIAIRAIKHQREQDYTIAKQVLKEVAKEKHLEFGAIYLFQTKLFDRLKNLKED